MRGARPEWLIRAAAIAAIATAVAWPAGAQAQVREARTCANQSQELVTERIAACARLVESGRLKGKPLGVAYGLRGLAFLDRGDIAHAIADLNRAVELAPDFCPRLSEPG